MRYYQNLLSRLINLTVDEDSLGHHQQNNTLDELYCGLTQDRDDLEKLYALLNSVCGVERGSFDQAMENLEVQLTTILEFYENTFTSHSFLGDQSAYDCPEVIVVLGSNRPLLDIRMRGAVDYLKDFPHAVAVFSGGGFSPVETESATMHKMARDAGVENCMLLEDMSMDTIGNALFTKFLLRREGLLRDATRITVITSCFHMPRSLHYFRTIFSVTNAQPIAVKGVRTRDHGLMKLGAREMESEYLASTTSGIFNARERDELDDQDMMIRLFRNHKLYQNRYDLLRRFLGSYCEG